MTDDVFTRRISETPGQHRLGRHVRHDPRSRRFAFDSAGLTVQPVRHQRNVPVFDQGDLGSCTGNASVGAIACDPTYRNLATAHPALDENLAIDIYSLATTLDDDPDRYPPTDTGSDGLSAAKALVRRGLISGYQHTFSLTDMLKALTLTAVFVGIDWVDSFDEPDARGLVKITKHAQVRGGHEICADEITADRLIGFTNSWTEQWGLQGRFYVSFKDMETLLANQGDVTVPVVSPPVSPVVGPVVPVSPTPSPAGPPGSSGASGPSSPTGPSAASAEDVALWVDMQKWARVKGLS